MAPIVFQHRPIGIAALGRGAALLAAIATAILAAPAAPVEAIETRLPADRLFAAQPDSPGPVTFRHETHVDPAPGVCLRCHPRPFSILGRRASVSHDLMDTGKTCGLCHDGREAFASSDPDACAICHDSEAVEGSP